MLVVSRKESEICVVGPLENPIGRVHIVSVKGEKVRLGFEFPKNIPIHRLEIAESILRGDPPPDKKTQPQGTEKLI